MFTTVFSQQSRHAALGMPAYRCVDVARLRALSPVKGGVSVLGGGITGPVRLATADLTIDPTTVPGTTAWSPPT